MAAVILAFAEEDRGGVCVSDLWRPTRVSSKNVLQRCQVRVSHKSVKKACQVRVSHKSVE